MDCFAVRIPPAGLNPTAMPVSCAYSRIARAITKPTGSVALVGSLPVEVLMKSAPAIMATKLALATFHSVSRSPAQRITFMLAGPQQPCRLPILLHCPASNMSWRPAFDGAGINANLFDPVEIERNAPIGYESVP